MRQLNCGTKCREVDACIADMAVIGQTCVCELPVKRKKKESKRKDKKKRKKERKKETNKQTNKQTNKLRTNETKQRKKKIE